MKWVSYLNKLHSNIILGRLSKEITDVHAHMYISSKGLDDRTRFTKKQKLYEHYAVKQ